MLKINSLRKQSSFIAIKPLVHDKKINVGDEMTFAIHVACFYTGHKVNTSTIFKACLHSKKKSVLQNSESDRIIV